MEVDSAEEAGAAEELGGEYELGAAYELGATEAEVASAELDSTVYVEAHADDHENGQ